MSSTIQVPTVLLDGAVLGILTHEDLYGYALTKQVQQHLSVSESTMYPVLRRLTKNGELETYDEPFEGRMRRYYRITPAGTAHLADVKTEWRTFSTAMTTLLGE